MKDRTRYYNGTSKWNINIELCFKLSELYTALIHSQRISHINSATSEAEIKGKKPLIQANNPAIFI